MTVIEILCAEQYDLIVPYNSVTRLPFETYKSE